MIKTVA